jgi:hypothetical protein
MSDGWTQADNGATGTDNNATGAGHPAGRWIDVKHAAAILGTSSDAIRKRVSRGTIPSRKLPDGSVQVWLDGLDFDQPVGGTGAGRASSDERRRDEMVESLHDQVSYLREVLNEERDARRRADTIIAQLTQANAFLARRVPELEPGQGGVHHGHETVADAPDRAPPRPPAEGTQEASGQRSWLYRFFFGP